MNDPIADSVRSILDGHIVLDRELASRGHYPCIDVLSSNSRLMLNLLDRETQNAVFEIRDLMGTHRKSEDLINIGAYKRGTNKRIDTAVERHDAIVEFLKQRPEDPSTLAETAARLRALVPVPR
jgi:flagellum-specific ATP synthase